jgi:hypothetical protein
MKIASHNARNQFESPTSRKEREKWGTLRFITEKWPPRQSANHSTGEILMREVHEKFDLLFTTDSLYRRPIIRDDMIRICVKNLALMNGHPLRTISGGDLEYLPNSHFIFKGVSSSKRKMTPYIGDPKLAVFGKEYKEVDGPFKPRMTTRTVCI